MENLRHFRIFLGCILPKHIFQILDLILIDFSWHNCFISIFIFLSLKQSPHGRLDTPLLSSIEQWNKLKSFSLSIFASNYWDRKKYKRFMYNNNIKLYCLPKNPHINVPPMRFEWEEI